MDPCAAVLETSAWVLASASHVSIDDAALSALSRELHDLGSAPAWANGSHFADDASEGGPLTAQYVLVLDALNWCFWPSSTSLEYGALALGLTRALRADPAAFSARALQRLGAETLRSWFLPHDLPDAGERARKLNEVGAVLEACFGGSAATLVARAGGSAVELVRLVAAHFPGFRDEAVCRGRQVFFYKRAQIFAADVWAAYGCLVPPVGAEAAASAPPVAALSPFTFRDIGALTCFADYRLPQLLWTRGALVLAPALAATVTSAVEVPPGSEEEVELRAATVQAVQRLRALLGGSTTSVEVDWRLWNRGEAELQRLRPHHRTRTIFY